MSGNDMMLEGSCEEVKGSLFFATSTFKEQYGLVIHSSMEDERNAGLFHIAPGVLECVVGLLFNLKWVTMKRDTVCGVQ